MCIYQSHCHNGLRQNMMLKTEDDDDHGVYLAGGLPSLKIA